MILLLLAYAWIAMNAFAPPAQAANYDGGVLFHFNCRQDNGQWSGWNVSANVKEGKFREDLFYRVNTITAQMPPLRQRKEDIPLLVEHFLSSGSPNYSKPKGMINNEYSNACY
jgi:hypothetical protein